MYEEEVESIVCHLGLEGVPRTIPVPFKTMATLFHDEDINEAQDVIGNCDRRFLTAEELLGPKHMGYPVKKYWDKDFNQEMVAILGPSEKMLNFGSHVKVRA